ncbi:MAG: hypothetical protein ABI868_10935 [Acidobacteriota bacterium]
MRAAIRSTALLSLLSLALAAWALRGIAQPAAPSFASRVERLSEEGGDFDTDNLISNERSYLEVIPALKAAGVSGGAYIGVGPDQNFSYIAQIRPAVAFIVDIRRDNLLLHLLFKALFTSAPTRVEYVSLLTGRPVPEGADTWRDASLERIVAYIDKARPVPEAGPGLDRRVHDIIAGFGVPLTATDFATIQRFHHTFIEAGLSLKFESRGRAPRSAYPTLRDLVLATDRTGRSWNYLASEAGFQFLRSLQTRDLVIPVVGDLGGEHALAAIADVMAARGDRLSALYISNVESYLYGNKPSQFVKNVTRLPRDAHSVIIRSIFAASISSSEVEPAGQFLSANRR